LIRHSHVYKTQPKKQITCMSSTHWHFLWQRPQQIMSRLSQEYNILFVDPPYPVAESEIPREKDGSFDISTCLNSVSASLKVISSYQIAEGGSDSHDNEIRAKNVKLLKEQIQQALHKIKWNASSLLWIYNPQAVSMVGALDEAGVIYDCVDSFSSFSWADPRTRKWEEELINKADVILTSARKLYNGWQDCGKPLYLVPNAADYEHFCKCGNTNSTAEPVDLKRIKHPRLGFIGAVYEWVDFELIKQLASCHPYWSMVMIGPKQHGLEIPDSHSNLHWLGPRDYKSLPWYLNHLDVMLIPFLLNETTEHANPIKLWEYLAAGKPVVTTFLPEIPRIAGVTWVSENSQQFCENCINALYAVRNSLKRGELTARARMIARSNSWEERCRQIVSILNEHFEE
jgi:UDP-galactopyranose mutase